MTATRVVIIMGVCGAGKTTVGRALAERLQWEFIEGDDFHPKSNIAAMAAGHPLTDADRAPWLAALRRRIEDILATGGHAVIACSALKHSYRSVLAGDEGGDEIRFVHLDVSPEELRRRLSTRVHHFMPPELLASQLATLEESRTALLVDGEQPVESIVDTIVHRLRLSNG
jgi:carbohydrate kinase (thermoresistant glucokinase family)